MDRGTIFFVVFLGYLVLSIASTKLIFRKTKTDKDPLKTILRSGVLALFFSPCAFIGHGILPAPALIVLGYSFDLTTGKLHHFLLALGSMAVTFLTLLVIGLINSSSRRPNRVAGGFSPPAPTPPGMRVRTGRFDRITGP